MPRPAGRRCSSVCSPEAAAPQLLGRASSTCAKVRCSPRLMRCRPTHRRPGCRPGSQAPPPCCRGTCRTAQVPAGIRELPLQRPHLQQIEKSSRQGGGAGRRRRPPNPSPERAVSGGDHHGAAGGLRGGAMGSSGEAGGWCVGVLAPPWPAPAPWRACSAPHSPKGGPRRCSAGCGP